VSIAAGRLAADSGEILRGGSPVSYRNAKGARQTGLVLVPQHDLLIGAASVADNLAFLDPAAPFFESAESRRTRVGRLAQAFGLELGAADARVDALPVRTRQRIEIAGALLVAGATALQYRLQAGGSRIPYAVFLALPGLLALFALAAARGRGGAPKALGTPAP